MQDKNMLIYAENDHPCFPINVGNFSYQCKTYGAHNCRYNYVKVNFIKSLSLPFLWKPLPAFGIG